MRPMATAVYLFCLNLIGVGIGPTIIGFLSDSIYAGSGAHSIAYALSTVQIAGLWAAWHHWKVMQEIGKPDQST